MPVAFMRYTPMIVKSSLNVNTLSDVSFTCYQIRDYINTYHFFTFEYLLSTVLPFFRRVSPLAKFINFTPLSNSVHKVLLDHKCLAKNERSIYTSLLNNVSVSVGLFFLLEWNHVELSKLWRR